VVIAHCTFAHVFCSSISLYCYYYIVMHCGFFRTVTAAPVIYTLSLHDALPIYPPVRFGIPLADLATALFAAYGTLGALRKRDQTDRKSTRLNSSHVKNSYAVFCLKKKNTDLNS